MCEFTSRPVSAYWSGAVKTIELYVPVLLPPGALERKGHTDCELKASCVTWDPVLKQQQKQQGRSYSSMVELLPTISKALTLTPSPGNRETERVIKSVC